MPHIRVKNLDEKFVETIAKDLVEIIIKESGASLEYVKVFYDSEKYIPVTEGRKINSSFPVIDVYWMPRPQDICNSVAKAFTEYFLKLDYKFVQVTFTEFKGNLFYENGVHY